MLPTKMQTEWFLWIGTWRTFAANKLTQIHFMRAEIEDVHIPDQEKQCSELHRSTNPKVTWRKGGWPNYCYTLFWVLVTVRMLCRPAAVSFGFSLFVSDVFIALSWSGNRVGLGCFSFLFHMYILCLWALVRCSFLLWSHIARFECIL